MERKDKGGRPRSTASARMAKEAISAPTVGVNQGVPESDNSCRHHHVSLAAGGSCCQSILHCFPGLDGSCSSAHQPKGKSESSVTKTYGSSDHKALYNLLMLDFADKFISAPEFSGHSYIALPTLTNAYSDLQLSMEFRQVALETCSMNTLGHST